MITWCMIFIFEGFGKASHSSESPEFQVKVLNTVPMWMSGLFGSLVRIRRCNPELCIFHLLMLECWLLRRPDIPIKVSVAEKVMNTCFFLVVLFLVDSTYLPRDGRTRPTWRLFVRALRMTAGRRKVQSFYHILKINWTKI